MEQISEGRFGPFLETRGFLKALVRTTKLSDKMLQIFIHVYECIVVSKIGRYRRKIMTRQSVSANFVSHIKERKLSKRVRMGPSQSFGIVTPEPPEIEKGIKLIAREGEKKFSKKRACGRFELSWEIHMKDQRRKKAEEKPFFVL